MFTIDEFIQIFASFCGTLGLCVLFNMRGKRMVFASIGAMIAWVLYILLHRVLANDILCYLIVSLLMAGYSEIFAYVLKTPAITFCIMSLIPLIPGSALYYSVVYALRGETQDFVDKAVHTLGLAIALSVGIIFVAAFTNYVKSWLPRKRQTSGR